MRIDELVPLLKETDNYPMHRYILKKDITEDICGKYTFSLANREYADKIDGMPVDDDTNLCRIGANYSGKIRQRLYTVLCFKGMA